MKTKIYNLIILDESGSMDSIKRETINGFNETNQTIKAAQKEHENQEHFVTLVTFNGAGIKTIYDKVSSNKIKELNATKYKPDCSTPLYDAIGMSVTNLKHFLSDQTDCTVLVTIITDGEENASKEYKGELIQEMIDELKLKGWIFTYIGANHDVEKFAMSISIESFLEYASDSVGTTEMNHKNCKTRKRAYNRLSHGFASQFLNFGFFSDEE
jgi:Mg-chelatase subunit ChlD